MNSMRTARLILAMAGILMAGGLASAQGPGGPGRGPGFGEHRPPMEKAFGFAYGQFWNNPNVAKRLNLSDDQRKAMDGILQDHKMKLIDLRANLEKAEVELGPLMKADTPDRGAIEGQIDKVVAARAALEKANALFLLDIRMKLTPDQWKQLRTWRMDRMHGDHMQGHEGWRHDGQRPSMGGPSGHGWQGRQFHKPPQGDQPPADGQPPAPAPPAGSGDAQ
ncbi:MAG: Spy/CpxP family protein refolding chaperone [Terracidiphilus sp.]